MVTELERKQANEVIKREISHLLTHNENFKEIKNLGGFHSEFITITVKGISIHFYGKDFRIDDIKTIDFDDVELKEKFWFYVNVLLSHYISDLNRDDLVEYLFKLNSII